MAAQSSKPVRRYHGTMTERNDILTVSRIDLVLILMPIISVDEARYAMSASGVPAHGVTRVIFTPVERRPLIVPCCVYETTPADDTVSKL
jgi:hypothetical protein